MKKILLLASITCFLAFFSAQNYITIKDNHFVKNNKPYYFIGTNYWYGGMLGTKSGNRERLKKELDELKSLGITNLRVMASAEGGDQDYTVIPATQPTPGKYNQDLLEGLDFFLNELRKRDMDAILYLTNNWEWSGGMAKYLEWNGYGKVPNPNIGDYTWPQFMSYTAQFHQCEPCKKQFLDHVKVMLNRKNTVNGIPYTKDKTIMAWELANEPRIWNVENEKAFTDWLNEVAATIKSIDKNHLLTTGSEGRAGSNDDITAFERTHNNPNIDYLTMHIWPKNWTWYNINDEKNSTEVAIKKTDEYIDEHIKVAQNLKKPLVLEEFGFPREKESLDKNSSVENRNHYYEFIFEKMKNSIKAGLPFTALNFWGYGGLGKNNPKNGKWNLGDDYTTDPPQEPQGLNSVFSTDKTTLQLIKKYNKKIKKLK
ncbi:endo-1,4-beta-mannosidase [Cloacibacterium rupense]|uniref:mannan endo-1,4-beta-mannosidase n=1 Tax=Cloacibacterium rupense TaxID=517423 RepID=A0ABQ2NI54_9FLAO|nr:cellulase family glycosylhydrolase [Cloacibacterium rupense]GGP02000.1 endo-1,4-beta-mannosidase [Cloacibacterium rupense]